MVGCHFLTHGIPRPPVTMGWTHSVIALPKYSGWNVCQPNTKCPSQPAPRSEWDPYCLWGVTTKTIHPQAEPAMTIALCPQSVHLVLHPLSATWTHCLGFMGVLGMVGAHQCRQPCRSLQRGLLDFWHLHRCLSAPSMPNLATVSWSKENHPEILSLLHASKSSLAYPPCLPRCALHSLIIHPSVVE